MFSFAGLRLLRPRTIAQLAKAGDEHRRELRDLTRSVKVLHEQVAAIRTAHEHVVQRLDAHQGASSDSAALLRAALTTQIGSLERKVGEVALRERQLRAIAQSDIELEPGERDLDAILQPAPVVAHVRGAVAAATLHHNPFPYAVVDNLLPQACYDALIRGLPPVDLFADRPVNKQQLRVPLDVAPRYSRRVWDFMSQVVAPDAVAPAVADKFAAHAAAWLKVNFPSAGDDPLHAIPLACSDGRILLRRPGYHIPPHRDPKWGFITCLFYLARPGDDERWGTELFRVDEDEEAKGAQPHWIDPQKCRLVEKVAFRPNRALIFLNSVGAHGSRIPEDAQPADLERYAYQFRIGAGGRTIQRLLADLPADRRPFWEGKVQAY